MAKYLPEMKKLMEKRLSRTLSGKRSALRAPAQDRMYPWCPMVSGLTSSGLQFEVSLNGSRSVEGVLRGYDQFMNVVLDDCVERSVDGAQRKLGMSVVRGNSIVSLEILPVEPT
jgi:small nuclear ribonucleoprotein G